MSLEGGVSARRPCGILGVALCAVALASTGRAGAEEYGPDLETYRVLIERYRSGEVDGPVRTARSWGPIWIESTAERLRKALERTPESSREGSSLRIARDNMRLAQGAFLLHAHTALAGLDMRLRSVDHDEHVEAAWKFLRWIRKRYVRDPASWPDEARGLRPRHFYLALASGELLVGCHDVVGDLTAESLGSQSRDGEMHLLAGCARETEAMIRRRSDGRWPDRTLGDAERCFREALDDDPSLLEARLRLGWVLVRRGRVDEARPLLEAVAAAPGDRGRRALAWLFLSAVHGEREDDDAEIAACRRAVELAPHIQAAQIALAHAREKHGGDAAAREVLAPFFLERSRSWVRNDPWNDYPFGPPELRLRPFEVLFERLCGR